MGTTLKLDRVGIELEGDERQAAWSFQSSPVTGTESVYRVRDNNFTQRRDWTFVVRTPGKKFGATYIEVRPTKVPNKKIWAGLEAKPLQFRRGTIGPNKGKVFSQLSIVGVEDGKKDVITDRAGLPTWLKGKGIKIVRRDCVITTKGHNGNWPVAVMDRHDHERMIKLYLALKPWVLEKQHAIK